jgi:hypothetical protein
MTLDIAFCGRLVATATVVVVAWRATKAAQRRIAADTADRLDHAWPPGFDPDAGRAERRLALVVPTVLAAAFVIIWL